MVRVPFPFSGSWFLGNVWNSVSFYIIIKALYVVLVARGVSSAITSIMILFSFPCSFLALEIKRAFCLQFCTLLRHRQYFTGLDLISAKCTILFMVLKSDLSYRLEVVICNLPDVKLFCELFNIKYQYENHFVFWNAIFVSDSK